MENLRDLLIHELQDTYHAEKQLLKALPKMVKAATSGELKEALESHLRETEEQVNRLAQVFDSLDEPVKEEKCEGMAGILEEGNELLREDAADAVKDAGLIASAQKAEHYEIASYGCLCAWAELLGEQDALDLLRQNLAEEEEANEKLTDIAERSINTAADQNAQAAKGR
jgi:ferritin-like metal-binding protein YciE